MHLRTFALLAVAAAGSISPGANAAHASSSSASVLLLSSSALVAVVLGRPMIPGNDGRERHPSKRHSILVPKEKEGTGVGRQPRAVADARLLPAVEDDEDKNRRLSFPARMNQSFKRMSNRISPQLGNRAGERNPANVPKELHVKIIDPKAEEDVPVEQDANVAERASFGRRLSAGSRLLSHNARQSFAKGVTQLRSYVGLRRAPPAHQDPEGLRHSSVVRDLSIEQAEELLKGRNKHMKMKVMWRASLDPAHPLDGIADDFDILVELEHRPNKSHIFVARRKNAVSSLFLIKMFMNTDGLPPAKFAKTISSSIAKYAAVEGCPNMVQYLQYRVVGFMHVLFMEYFAGQIVDKVIFKAYEGTVEDVNQKPPVFLPNPLRIGDGFFAQTVERKVLETLACIHDKGFSYQDLSPSNVMVRLTGTPASPELVVKLIDFDTIIKDNGDTILLAALEGGDASQHPAIYRQAGDYEGSIDLLPAAEMILPSSRYSDGYSAARLLLAILRPETKLGLHSEHEVILLKGGVKKELLESYEFADDLLDFLLVGLNKEISDAQLPKALLDHAYINSSRLPETVPEFLDDFFSDDDLLTVLRTVLNNKGRVREREVGAFESNQAAQGLIKQILAAMEEYGRPAPAVVGGAPEREVTTESLRKSQPDIAGTQSRPESGFLAGVGDDFKLEDEDEANGEGKIESEGEVEDEFLNDVDAPEGEEE